MLSPRPAPGWRLPVIYKFGSASGNIFNFLFSVQFKNIQSGFEQLDDVAKTLLDEYTSKANTSSKNVPSAGNTGGNTTIKPTTTQPTQSTQDTQGTKDTQGSATTQADKMTKGVDKAVASSIQKLQKDPEFAKIIKFADLVAKNKK